MSPWALSIRQVPHWMHRFGSGMVFGKQIDRQEKQEKEEARVSGGGAPLRMSVSTARRRPDRARLELVAPRDAERAVRKRIFIVVAIVLVACAAFSLVDGGNWLILDNPHPADVIVVLGGSEDARSLRAIELLREGYAQHALIDTFHWSSWGVDNVDLARSFIQSKPDVAPHIELCVMQDQVDSTRTEAKAAAACLKRLNARSVLLVTSDYHTRRALTIFRHELPEYQFNVAAYRDPGEFGAHWWKHREWAAHFWMENLKLAWFNVAYRWRD